MENPPNPGHPGSLFSTRPDIRKIMGWMPAKSIVQPNPYPWEIKLGHVTSRLAAERRMAQNGPPRRNKLDYLRHCMSDYCQNTSLHGLKYITADDTFRPEKALWFLLCTLAIIGAVCLLYPIFDTYSKSPMSTAVESTSAPIYKIPFPGVTICNVNKATQEMIEKNMPNHPWHDYETSTVKEAVNILSEIGTLKLEKTAKSDGMIETLMVKEGRHLDALMKNVSQPLERMALLCWWQGVAVNCTDIFEQRRTDEGYCWSFNSMPMKKSAPGKQEDDVYDEQAHNMDVTHADYQTTTTTESYYFLTPLQVPKKQKIRHVNGAGPNIGLTVLLNPDTKRYFAPTNEFYGFKVVIHNPEDFPSVSTKGFLVSAGREAYVAVSATSTDTDDEIKNVPQSSRDCFFQTDKSLKFYETYSYENCLLDCQVASMHSTCQCTPYLYALLETSKPCNYTGIECINRNIERFYSIKPPGNEIIEGLEETKTMKKCKCRSSCDDVSYVTEVTAAQFPTPTTKINTITFDETIDFNNTVLLRVFFKDLYYVKYRRSLLYTWIQAMSNFGGIVGLFIGFSFVSGAEIVYFFTLRPLLRWKDYFKRSNAPDIDPR